MKVSDIGAVDCILDVVGDEKDKVFNNVKPLSLADAETIIWIHPLRKDKEEIVEKTRSQVILCDKSLDIKESWLDSKCFVVVGYPKITFMRVIEKFFNESRQIGVAESSVVDDNAVIGTDVFIGANSVIGDVVIGDNVSIMPNCTIYDNVKIGNNVVVHANSVIGSDGFGYARKKNGEIEKFIHKGGVTVGDNVEIHSNVCIDRGELKDTFIGDGTKIDNFVHISHNVQIGKHCFIIAHAMIGGASIIGDYSWIAPNSAIKERIVVGNRSMVGIGSTVIRDVVEGSKVFGNPAKIFITPDGDRTCTILED